MKHLHSAAAALALLCAGTATAAGTDGQALWLRYPAISPDGKTVAFSYMGDIYTVPASGGPVSRLTVSPAYETRPLWSPDGQTIVFSSDRHGAANLYSIPAGGGAVSRITRTSGSQTPLAWLNDSTVLFRQAGMADVLDSQFPSSSFPQVYAVTVTGGRPQLFSSLAMDELSVDPAGRIVYQDKKGYEDPLRKHQRSSIARDIWLASAPGADGKRSYTKLTANAGEDREPVWIPGQDAFYYLAEGEGTSLNIHRMNADGSGDVTLTKLPTHPVRHLSVSNGGTLCFSYDGRIFTMTPGGQPVALDIAIAGDTGRDEPRYWSNPSGLGAIALSEKGKEVAFVMRGDVYVTATEYNTTKRITDTPEQERNVDFAPDGRSLVYSAERNGHWGIYRASLVRPEDKHFAYAREIKEEPLVTGDFSAFQPKFSPDGKEIAYLKDRTELMVLNLETMQSRTVLPGEYNYSYTDGDQTYSWSPDGKWFLAEYIDRGGWNNSDIVLVKADGSGEMTNLTQSGYSDGNPKWVLGGKAMMWMSDRAGYRSHGSWGSERDWYIMFLDGEAYDRFLMSKEEQELADEAEKKDDGDKKEDDDKKDKKGKKGKKESEAKTDDKPALTFDLANRRHRIVRLTPNSSSLADGLLSDKGDKVYYTASFEGGADLWMHDLKDGSTSLLVKGLGWGALIPDAKMENIYLNSGGIKKVNLGSRNTSWINYDAQFTYRPAQEREYIFNHVWQQVADKFYDRNIHGIDWAGYRDAYAKFLPHINNNYDFQELLSELLGELNGSHTGARFRGNNATSPELTEAYLGAFFDNGYTGDGLRIAEILTGGPLDKAALGIAPGNIIESIDGTPIAAGQPWTHLLAGKAGKTVALSVLDPATGSRAEKIVKPVGSQSRMLYKRWTEAKRHLVDSLSGGRIGYIHVEGMDSPSFRETYSDLLGMYRNADAVIIDTRHNGGGWLHDDLATLLSGKQYARFVPRGQFVGNDPFNKWLKPSCVLVCEDNYSNAHGFPWVYKTLGIGKLIGTPVPGTMTAVWWENQIDPTLVFGVPQVGCSDMQGRYLENLELQPDILIYNTPEDQLAGRDPQLERAVQEMLREADAFKAAQPEQPAQPQVSPVYSK